MIKIIGGDYAGYSIRLTSHEILLRYRNNRITITRAEIVGVEVLDTQQHTSGVRMAAKSYVFSKMGLGGLWGGLSARSKRKMVVGIKLVGGHTILVQTTEAGYRRLLKYSY